MQSNCNSSPELMRAVALSKAYAQRRGLFGRGFAVEALCGVDFEIHRGSTMAIVGESGSGKSALAKCLAGIETADRGEIWLEGRNLTAIPAARRLAAFRAVQLVFQDSASSLNPGFTAEEIVAEPLVIERWGTASDRKLLALNLIEQVGIDAKSASRRPLEFSGGQRQRLAIARALALQPKLIILDEALSGLDLLTRSQIVDLLRELQAQQGLTYLHITHDMDLARRWSDEVVAMRSGRIAERRPPSLSHAPVLEPELADEPLPVRVGG